MKQTYNEKYFRMNRFIKFQYALGELMMKLALMKGVSWSSGNLWVEYRLSR